MWREVVTCCYCLIILSQLQIIFFYNQIGIIVKRLKFRLASNSVRISSGAIIGFYLDHYF